MYSDVIKTLYGVSERKYSIPADLIEVIKENFVNNGAALDNNAATALIEKYPSLLNHTAVSLQARFDLFEEFGWTNKRILTQALRKNKNIFTMNKDDLVKKVLVFNSLGFSSDILIKNPLLLSCPLKDIKLKYMLAKFEGYNVNNISYFLQSLNKSYARVCYIMHAEESIVNNLTLTEKQFAKKFNVTDKEIQQTFQLSAEAINAIEFNYNVLLENNPSLPEIILTKKEKQESINRISIKELKKQFKIKKEQEKLERLEILEKGMEI